MRILAHLITAALFCVPTFSQDTLSRVSSWAAVLTYDGSSFNNVGLFYWATPRLGLSGSLHIALSPGQSPRPGEIGGNDIEIGPALGIQYVVYSYRSADIALVGQVSSAYKAIDYSDGAAAPYKSEMRWIHGAGLGLAIHLTLTDQLSLGAIQTYSFMYYETRVTPDPRNGSQYYFSKHIYRSLAADKGKLFLMFYF